MFPDLPVGFLFFSEKERAGEFSSGPLISRRKKNPILCFIKKKSEEEKPATLFCRGRRYAELTVFSNNDNNNCSERRNSGFFTISSLRRELLPTRTLKWPGRNRVLITSSA